MEKKCTKCGVTKELEEFYICRSNKDGRRYQCKACDKARYHSDWEVAYRARRKAEELLYSQGLKRCNKCGKIKPLTSFHINKKCRHGLLTSCKACTKQYRQESRERIKAYGVQYRIEHAAEIAERSAQHYHSSEKGIAAKKRREERELLFIQGLKKCSKCNEVKALEMFYNSRRHRYGKDSRCKTCRKKYEAERKTRKVKHDEGERRLRLPLTF